MEKHAQLTARDIHGPFMQLLTNLQGDDGQQWLNALNKFLRKENPWPASTAPSIVGPVFNGPRVVYRIVDGRLISEDGKPLTGFFHEFKNSFPELVINGRRYFLAEQGACSYIHEIDVDGTVTNVSQNIEDPDQHEFNAGWGERGMGFHSVEYNRIDRMFVGSLGAARYHINPKNWGCERR